jgi:Heterokaryon incompatibility protein (HET)
VDSKIRKIDQRSRRYIALSYVCGGVQPVQLTKGNREVLEQTNSLNKYERLLPQTFKDAIILVSQIGERYLWINSLCTVLTQKYLPAFAFSHQIFDAFFLPSILQHPLHNA